MFKGVLLGVLLAVMLNNLYLVTSIYFLKSATRLIATSHTIRISTAIFPQSSQRRMRFTSDAFDTELL